MTEKLTLEEVLLNLHLKYLVEYDTDELFTKTKEQHLDEINEMGDGEKFELIECNEMVDEKFEDGGRWSNYRIMVFKVRIKYEDYYIKVRKEQPATEMQEGGDFSTDIWLVEKKKIETYVYE